MQAPSEVFLIFFQWIWKFYRWLRHRISATRTRHCCPSLSLVSVFEWCFLLKISVFKLVHARCLQQSRNSKSVEKHPSFRRSRNVFEISGMAFHIQELELLRSKITAFHKVYRRTANIEPTFSVPYIDTGGLGKTACFVWEW